MGSGLGVKMQPLILSSESRCLLLRNRRRVHGLSQITQPFLKSVQSIRSDHLRLAAPESQTSVPYLLRNGTGLHYDVSVVRCNSANPCQVGAILGRLQCAMQEF